MEKMRPSALPADRPLVTHKDLALALGGDDTSFTGDLLRLIAKADHVNKGRLREAFPYHVVAYDIWLPQAPHITAGELRGHAQDIVDVWRETGVLAGPGLYARVGDDAPEDAVYDEQPGESAGLALRGEIAVPPAGGRQEAMGEPQWLIAGMRDSNGQAVVMGCTGIQVQQFSRYLDNPEDFVQKAGPGGLARTREQARRIAGHALRIPRYRHRLAVTFTTLTQVRGESYRAAVASLGDVWRPPEES